MYLPCPVTSGPRGRVSPNLSIESVNGYNKYESKSENLHQKTKNSFKKNKNKNPKNDKTTKIKLGTLNVRTLKGDEKQIELERAFKKSNLDILGSSEVRREGEKMIQTKEGSILCWKGEKGGQKGVGFLMKEEWRKKLSEFKE